MSHDVFISYSSKDKATADVVCATLESHGSHCWIAPRDVLPGEEYASALVRALRDSRLMVLIFSSNANQSPQVLREVERAVSRGLPILPLRIENIAPSAAMEFYISSRHWLDALTPPIEPQLLQLAETVQTLLSRSSSGEIPADPVQAVNAALSDSPPHQETQDWTVRQANPDDSESRRAAFLRVWGENPAKTPNPEDSESRRAASTSGGSASTAVEVLHSEPNVERIIPAPVSLPLARKPSPSRLTASGTPLAELRSNELTIGFIVKLSSRLNTRDLALGIGVVFMLFAAVFLGGWVLRGALKPSAALGSSDPVEASKQLQEVLVKRPSIAAFEGYLRAAQGKHWTEAYSLLGPSWKEGADAVTKPDDLARIYRRTLRHDFNYFVPTLVSDDREEYNVDLTFTDAIPLFPVRDALANSRISAVLQPAQINSLADELARELPNDYTVPNDKRDQLSPLIRNTVAQLTLRDIVLRDDFIELIGRNLGLEPIVSHDTFQGGRAGTPKERFFKVVLVKQQGRWLVDSYDSFMVEKR